MNNLSDHELIRRCLDDEDRTAWEAFVRKYSKLIWNAIHKTFHQHGFAYQREDAEDVFSSLYLSLIENKFKRLREFRGENACALSTWLSVVTIRLTIDYLRKDKNHLNVKSGQEDSDIWDLIPDNRYQADTLVEKKQAGEKLKKSVDALSARDKMLYELTYNKGFSPEETAAAMGMSVAAVYTQKHRIIAKIKKNIERV
jgi:RNA polymerase sigma-70 factor (ECF subfamily)